ncbi:carboxymuconolactone decarboxylase family protein [Mucilaginibacter pallidiroseus]|uniref:Carboxymuconolactone decarboxylase family protein n=1 Tax=Mucilaginibacter pallidiroseus TaxID=2599295 RepID=A0A563TZ51_9SPHI|nr:carboxymuconolactone decarboxylase family protein [Mucilaginibacter pallidiroseus]TWR24410.1 carboxymuconolactone decarboxylase family protein [Mucilaginibacter pallidiroseus]
MEKRLNVYTQGQPALKTLFGIHAYLKNSSLEKSLLELVYTRVSQINGCAYCLDMHTKDARHGGETEQRLYGLNAWKDSPFYNEKERTALGWAEAVTYAHVSDAHYREALSQLSEAELIDLTLAVTTINTWNRINIAFAFPAGSYVVGQFG